MNSQATDPPMIEALEGASSLQLYQLKALIEGMLADPRRGIAARASLHNGSSARSQMVGCHCRCFTPRRCRCRCPKEWPPARSHQAPQAFAALRGYAFAVPGQEPGLPPGVQLWSHHLHCVMHSAPVAGLVTLIVWAARRAFWIPLLGWWSHIAIDVFTHSADYYAVRVLYPFTTRGFDGIAWITPWFMALNYAALAVIGGCLVLSRRRANGH